MNEVSVAQTGVNPVAQPIIGYGNDRRQLEAQLSHALRVRQVTPTNVKLSRRSYLSPDASAATIGQQVVSL